MATTIRSTTKPRLPPSKHRTDNLANVTKTVKTMTNAKHHFVRNIMSQLNSSKLSHRFKSVFLLIPTSLLPASASLPCGYRKVPLEQMSTKSESSKAEQHFCQGLVIDVWSLHYYQFSYQCMTEITLHTGALCHTLAGALCHT